MTLIQMPEAPSGRHLKKRLHFAKKRYDNREIDAEAE